MIRFELDISRVAEVSKRRVEAFTQELLRKFTAAGAFIRDLFKKEWLSGRRSDDTGLNVRTGNLRQSIQSQAATLAHAVTGGVFNTGADYIGVHIHGASGTRSMAFGKPTNPYSWSIPARLAALPGIFANEGGDKYKGAVSEAFSLMAAVR